MKEPYGKIKMFKTIGNNIDMFFYRTNNEDWFLEENDIITAAGFKCIGSIDMTKNPAFKKVVSGKKVESYRKIVSDICEEMEKGPPFGYTPFFIEENCPLIVISIPELGIAMGNEIIEVYHSI